MDLMKNYKMTKYNTTKRRPHMINWDITNKCNMRCKHCFNDSGDASIHSFQNELTRKEQLDLAQQLTRRSHNIQICTSVEDIEFCITEKKFWRFGKSFV